VARPHLSRECLAKTEKLQLLAHRPNVSYPTFAAKTFATVDQVSDGRVTVHFITGGTDQEQQREGDYLTKDERYERTVVEDLNQDGATPTIKAAPSANIGSANSSRPPRRRHLHPGD
jgi:alkanesulfonate monooxygenase SsuD/methylene tetrahydromethanopterin reductase-like flavin-dependent oxidoreductase (luciferase family)